MLIKCLHTYARSARARTHRLTHVHTPDPESLPSNLHLPVTQASCQSRAYALRAGRGWVISGTNNAPSDNPVWVKNNNDDKNNNNEKKNVCFDWKQIKTLAIGHRHGFSFFSSSAWVSICSAAIPSSGKRGKHIGFYTLDVSVKSTGEPTVIQSTMYSLRYFCHLCIQTLKWIQIFFYDHWKEFKQIKSLTPRAQSDTSEVTSKKKKKRFILRVLSSKVLPNVISAWQNPRTSCSQILYGPFNVTKPPVGYIMRTSFCDWWSKSVQFYIQRNQTWYWTK